MTLSYCKPKRKKEKNVTSQGRVGSPSHTDPLGHARKCTELGMGMSEMEMSSMGGRASDDPHRPVWSRYSTHIIKRLQRIGLLGCPTLGGQELAAWQHSLNSSIGYELCGCPGCPGSYGRARRHTGLPAWGGGDSPPPPPKKNPKIFAISEIRAVTKVLSAKKRVLKIVRSDCLTPRISGLVDKFQNRKK